ncbi:hypothetical protein CMUS01_00361 [Colletotrichum musicola]|uniref:Uncharacterized protein n=1 Tax=Colletotrichum musicola TaxID=2175873 RepID=A0A8H6NZ52_9PEZI|nr:hypothetical protein CMUS01_00361 [Colletotrichum musicola]
MVQQVSEARRAGDTEKSERRTLGFQECWATASQQIQLAGSTASHLRCEEEASEGSRPLDEEDGSRRRRETPDAVGICPDPEARETRSQQRELSDMVLIQSLSQLALYGKVSTSLGPTSRPAPHGGQRMEEDGIMVRCGMRTAELPRGREAGGGFNAAHRHRRHSRPSELGSTLALH